MFQNPFAVFFAIIVLGVTLIGQYDDICRLGDCFNGRALSASHQAEHIDRDFRGFYHLLAFAVFTAFVVLLINCLTDNDYQPKKFFIKDLVTPKDSAAGTAKNKMHTQTNSAKAHKPSHAIKAHTPSSAIKAHKPGPSHATKTRAQSHAVSAKVQSRTDSTTKQSHTDSTKAPSH